MPCARSNSPGPTPDSCNSCGELIDPPASNTSRRALALRTTPPASTRGQPRVCLEQNAECESLNLDAKIGAFHRRPQIGHCSAAAPHIADGQLQRPASVLLGAVEIRVQPVASFLRSGDKPIMEFVPRPQIGDIEGSPGPVMLIGAAFLVLGLPEIGQHILVGPAGIAELPPQIEILPLAADVDNTDLS